MKKQIIISLLLMFVLFGTNVKAQIIAEQNLSKCKNLDGCSGANLNPEGNTCVSARDGEEPIKSSVIEARNRYWLDLVSTGNGTFKLKDEDWIRRLNIFNVDNAPKDMFLPYEHKNIFTTPQDYQRCETRRFVYKTYPNYTLDLEVDIPNGKGPFPFMIWIHGGGWEAGDFSGMKTYSTYMASHGIAGVRIHYSLRPKGAKMADAWQDIQDAVKFIQDHAEELKIDGSKFGFGGHSAGAHLSAYAAMRTPGTKLLVGLNGAYDIDNVKPGFEPNDHHFQFLGTTSAMRRKASPINFVHPDAPFCLLAYSTGDTYVDQDQVHSFIRKLNENNVPNQLLLAELYHHSGFLTTDLIEPTLMKVLNVAKEVFSEECDCSNPTGMLNPNAELLDLSLRDK